MASADEIWLVDFGEPFPGEPARHRPAVILGPPDAFGAAFPYVFVCPMTTARRGLSLHVEIDATAETGLDAPSYVQCELVRSISRERLLHRLGRIDLASRTEIREIVGMLLGS